MAISTEGGGVGGREGRCPGGSVFTVFKGCVCVQGVCVCVWGVYTPPQTQRQTPPGPRDRHPPLPDPEADTSPLREQDDRQV